MTTYCVSHRRSGRSYHLRASTSKEAIERVTLVLADLGGMEAWEAVPEADRDDIPHGSVLDDAGRPVRSLEA